MIKSAIALAAAAPLMAAPALAGPYVNVEANASWTGDDYTATTTDVHVGYEGVLGDTGASYYVQLAQRSSLLTVLKLRLNSLVRQVLDFLFPMLSESMVRFPS